MNKTSSSSTFPWTGDQRLGGLRRFAAALTTFNLLGHTVFGFEQSPAQPICALLAAYGTELLLEWLYARSSGRAPRFAGGRGALVNFLLPAHISGLAVSMLLYANDRIGPVVLAAVTAIATKTLFRVRSGAGSRHFLNPSNAGITAVLLLFPWVGIAPPYHFTENLHGAMDWVLPALIVASGSFLNARFTRKLPLIAAWLGGFAAQAALRSAVNGTPLLAALAPMTGLAFVLYTFYMLTDPPTSPAGWKAQVAFGLAVAAAYGLLMSLHVVFGLFFALTTVCVLRGLGMAARQLLVEPAAARAPEKRQTRAAAAPKAPFSEAAA